MVTFLVSFTLQEMKFVGVLTDIKCITCLLIHLPVFRVDVVVYSENLRNCTVWVAYAITIAY